MLADGCGSATDPVGRRLVEATRDPSLPGFFPPDLLVFTPDRALVGRAPYHASPAEHLALLRAVLEAHPELGTAPVGRVGPEQTALRTACEAQDAAAVVRWLAAPPDASDDRGHALCALAALRAREGDWGAADALWEEVLSTLGESPLAHRAHYNRHRRSETWVMPPHPDVAGAPPRSLPPVRVPDPPRRARVLSGLAEDARLRLRHTGLPVAWVPPGTFTMGGTPAYTPREAPTRQVTLTRGRWVSVFPVTRRIWARFDPDRLPVGAAEGLSGEVPMAGITFSEALAFCDFWSAEVGARVRLLTEAEWEFAARGGLEGGRHPWGDAAMTEAHCNFAELHAVPVGCYAPNGYGLCDLVGNGLEWTSDRYAEDAYSQTPPAVTDPSGPAASDWPDHYACRGGLYGASFAEVTCRVSFRLGFEDGPVSFAASTVGLRIALDTLPPAR